MEIITTKAIIPISINVLFLKDFDAFKIIIIYIIRNINGKYKIILHELFQ